MHELKLLQTATDELNRFLSLNVEEIDGNELQPIAAIQQQSELEHVSVKDSNGRQLLEDVSITFQPGQLIGVVATQKLQAHALVELLMGFGRPSSGRMLVDGQLVSKLNPHSLIGCSHWVASDGAIVTGTVLENIRGSKPSQSTRSLSEVLEAARLTETVQKVAG